MHTPLDPSAEPGAWPAPATPSLPPTPRAAERGRGRRLPPAVAVLTLMGVAAGSGALAGYVAGESAAVTAVTTPEAPGTVTPVALAPSPSLDVGAIVERLAPSVVSIETTAEVRRGPFTQRASGAGTGVVIDDGGLILTNAHVVEGATSVTVSLDGGSSSRAATVVATDRGSDIAILRVDDATGLRPAPVAAADSASVGDEVVAIGNALALDGGMTVTRGIVSAVGRSIETGGGSLTHLLQTDAAISSGNSGGPLVNASAEVIGINTAVAGSGGGVQASNIGFAISIDRALEVADQLLGADGVTA